VLAADALPGAAYQREMSWAWRSWRRRRQGGPQAFLRSGRRTSPGVEGQAGIPAARRRASISASGRRRRAQAAGSRWAAGRTTAWLTSQLARPSMARAHGAAGRRRPDDSVRRSALLCTLHMGFVRTRWRRRPARPPRAGTDVAEVGRGTASGDVLAAQPLGMTAVREVAVDPRPARGTA
jgi:hypothetical protein